MRSNGGFLRKVTIPSFFVDVVNAIKTTGLLEPS